MDSIRIKGFQKVKKMKQSRISKTKQIRETIVEHNNSSPKKEGYLEIKVESEDYGLQNPSYANKCRVCLNEGDMLIYGEETFDLIEPLIMFGGIEVQADDDFPKYLCHDCHEQLQSAIKFRQTAQETEQILKNSLFPPDAKPMYDVMEQCDNEDDDEKEQCDDEKEFFKKTLADSYTIYHCRSCDLDFKTSTEYGQHMLTDYHAKKKDRCPFCCRESVSIKKHLSMHVRFETVFCDICGEKYLKPNLLRHQESHGDSLPFKCSQCPYEGRYAGDFKVHMRTHTGERPYECSYCSSRFISKSNLNRHILTHKSNHTFQCDECTKGFYKQRDLDVHIKVNHIGLKDHLCTQCGKAFGYRRALMKHVLQVHKRKKLRSGRMPVFMRIKMVNNDTSDN